MLIPMTNEDIIRELEALRTLMERYLDEVVIKSPTGNNYFGLIHLDVLTHIIGNLKENEVRTKE